MKMLLSCLFVLVFGFSQGIAGELPDISEGDAYATVAGIDSVFIELLDYEQGFVRLTFPEGKVKQAVCSSADFWTIVLYQEDGRSLARRIFGTIRVVGYKTFLLIDSRVIITEIKY